jgi:hypothetical protein
MDLPIDVFYHHAAEAAAASLSDEDRQSCLIYSPFSSLYNAIE